MDNLQNGLKDVETTKELATAITDMMSDSEVHDFIETMLDITGTTTKFVRMNMEYGDILHYLNRYADTLDLTELYPSPLKVAELLNEMQENELKNVVYLLVNHLNSESCKALHTELTYWRNTNVKT